MHGHTRPYVRRKLTGSGSSFDVVEGGRVMVDDIDQGGVGYPAT